MLQDKAQKHLLSFLELSIRLFEESHHGFAAFFAITLIEEVGKIIVLWNRELSGHLDRKSFYSHRTKYLFAVGWTLPNNSRIRRIYGDQELRFDEWFREGRLLKLRNSSLYLEHSGEDVIVPEEAISAGNAFLLVCFAGEVLAEIQGICTGTDSDEWKGIIDQVDTFRVRNSISISKSPP